MLNWFKGFNSNYAEAVQALTPILLGFISFAYYKVYKERQLKEGDAASSVRPSFWTLGRKFKILAVHKYEKSEDDVSGYKHLGQNSRKDQWKKLIKIKSYYFNLKHEIIPKDSEDILTVIISRNGKEKWKNISFNK